MEKKVFFDNGKGTRLAGVLHIPRGKVLAPGVVICHGFKSDKERQRVIALEFEKRGFVTLRFDFFGSGESGGKFEDVTITEEIGDLGKALDFLEKQKQVDRKRMAVFGTSLGGIVSLMQAARDKRIKALALRAPVSNFRQVKLKEAQGDGLVKWKRDGIVYTNNSLGTVFKIKYGFYLDGLKYNAYKKVKSIACPVLVIHGDGDETIPLEQSRKLVSLLQKAELRVFIGQGHIFDEEAKKRAGKEAAEWMGRAFA